jgi:hypothetical protein
MQEIARNLALWTFVVVLAVVMVTFPIQACSPPPGDMECLPLPLWLIERGLSLLWGHG